LGVGGFVRDVTALAALAAFVGMVCLWALGLHGIA
jgi:hypothetical protein